jgi:Flp pilus assembly protein TadB
MNPFPDLPAGSPLTDRERLIVETIADRERAADPAFARRLAAPSRASRRPALLVAALAVLGLALLVLPGLWVVAVVAVAVLIVVPAFLVAWALRQGDLPPG